jgi:hypothetical protein
MAGILEALAVKPDGEDPLVAAVRRHVTIGSESVFSLMMMHEVQFDAEKVTSTSRKMLTDVTSRPRAMLLEHATWLLG